MDQINTSSHMCFVFVVLQNFIYDFEETHHMAGIIKRVLWTLFCVSCQISFHCPFSKALARQQCQILGHLLLVLTSGFLADSLARWEH